ncbi:hypothetical protein E2C01_046481 [Portunus trituberculatus]|uniref:Uncharacterized protein n=1 Tax=Portunus trituberculatus TaxID=210409 RepID=A0A5B7G4W5_PORTR|nr:hypothetical protein [Portunus trituberculatus]
MDWRHRVGAEFYTATVHRIYDNSIEDIEIPECELCHVEEISFLKLPIMCAVMIPSVLPNGVTGQGLIAVLPRVYVRVSSRAGMSITEFSAVLCCWALGVSTCSPVTQASLLLSVACPSHNASPPILDKQERKIDCYTKHHVTLIFECGLSPLKEQVPAL